MIVIGNKWQYVWTATYEYIKYPSLKKTVREIIQINV